MIILKKQIETKYVLALSLYLLVGILSLSRLKLIVLSTEWVNFFDISKIRRISDVLEFYKNLSTGISPILSLFEFIEYLLHGEVIFFRVWASRLVILLNFLMASHLYASKKTIVYRLLLSTILVCGLSLIGGMNYDWFWPFFIICHLYLLKVIQSKEKTSLFLAFLSGMMLSFGELSRPFVIFVLPILIFNFYLRTRVYKRNYLVWFLLPIFIFSGGWRLKLFYFNGPQVIWSDYGGCNLYESWPNIGRKIGYDYLNTAKGRALCEEGKEKVVKHILANPLETIGISIKKIFSFTKARAHWHGMENVRVSYIYRLVLKVHLTIFLIQAIYFNIQIFKNIKILFEEKNLIMLMTCIYFIFLSIPNDGSERARFVACFSPFLLLVINWNFWERLFSRVKRAFDNPEKPD